MGYDAKIVADSVGPNGARVTTFELTMPRIVLAEHNTHRMFSRNAASSRAIPVEKLLGRVEEDPMLPAFWGKNQSGMQAAEELQGDEREDACHLWLVGRDRALDLARTLAKIGLHKQIANRVVEPWMFTTVVCTATEWDNAWALRVDPMAQPEYERTMRMAYDAYRASEPRVLAMGEWHLPYVSFDDEIGKWNERELCMISAGRCAAVTYLNQGQADAVGDLARAAKILKSGHMSPFEHQCRAMTESEWNRYAREAAEAWVADRVPVGNIWGFHQFRKELANEHNYQLIKGAR
jgi:hypothetical protein